VEDAPLVLFSPSVLLNAWENDAVIDILRTGEPATVKPLPIPLKSTVLLETIGTGTVTKPVGVITDVPSDFE
jgi:hypothetical protein